MDIASMRIDKINILQANSVFKLVPHYNVIELYVDVDSKHLVFHMPTTFTLSLRLPHTSPFIFFIKDVSSGSIFPEAHACCRDKDTSWYRAILMDFLSNF